MNVIKSLYDFECKFYRNNVNIVQFAEEYLNLRLFKYQKLLLCMFLTAHRFVVKIHPFMYYRRTSNVLICDKFVE